ncbi:hypothetical protein [Ketobacter alkanivorans]|uniref:Thioredoxin-like fold domain-containing protein n=1 Tax=Ketobacter alkanivorans TaxID=1917421 RepID=A0A2K9LFK7_9GAMM|nr:hypothetical protein [Ketobacter alkanivorans]AUM11148.1 hypothetical protein Kalk_01285 [Ketobacter alkanivorans]
MKITLVKKILADGSPCKKCGEVIGRLEDSGQIDRINEILVADERDPTSAGMLLAAELNVDRAPFFVVDYDDGRQSVYTVYFKFVKEVLDQQTEEKDELKEILHNNPDLDFL